MKMAAFLAAATLSPARVPSLRDSMNCCLLAIMAALSTSAGVSGASDGGARLAIQAS